MVRATTVVVVVVVVGGGGTIIDGTIFQRKKFTNEIPPIPPDVSRFSRPLNAQLVGNSLRDDFDRSSNVACGPPLFFFFAFRILFTRTGVIGHPVLFDYLFSSAEATCHGQLVGTLEREYVVTAYGVHTSSSSSSSWLRRYPVPRDGYVTAAVTPYLIPCRYITPNSPT